VDADNDGYLDLMVLSQLGTTNPRNYLYMNNGGTGFTDSPANFQSNAIGDSRAIANGDFNNDGRTDCAVLNSYGSMSFLWQNTGTTGNHIKLTLHGTISNRMAIGSWIEIHSGNNTYSHYTKCGENYLGQNSQHLIFGVGAATQIDSIKITYPSGIIDRYTSISVNQTLDLYEGETWTNEIAYNQALNFCAGDTVVLDAGNYSSYLWSNGYTGRYLSVTQSGNYWVDVTNQLGLNIPSDTLEVFVSNMPQISFNNNNISCNGLNNGSLSLNINNQTSNFTVNWSNGITAYSINNLAPGTYQYFYTDVFNCTVTDSISLTEPYPIVVNYQENPVTINGLGSLQFIVNGGTAPYQVSFNGNNYTNIINNLQAGNYSITVTDANGCSYVQNFTILDLTTEAINLRGSKISIYPNPLHQSVFYFESVIKIDNVRIYDCIGKLIPCTVNSESNSGIIHNTVQMESIYKGLMIVEVLQGDDVLRFKLLKI
jgi:hypothetical protein